MPDINALITDNLDVWASTVHKKKTTGRGSSKKIELYGVKKLRELILELAMRGLLVPQDPMNSPASDTIKLVLEFRDSLVKQKKIKKAKAPEKIIEKEDLPNLPNGWIWSCINEVAELSPRNDLDDDLEVSFISMPSISTNYDGSHSQESRRWGEVKKGYTHFAEGDIGLAKITPCFENSKAAIFRDLTNNYGAGTTELHIARLFGDFTSEKFVLLYLKSPQFLKVGETKMTGSAGQKRVPKDFFAFNPLPLPPIEEQKRIVVKVDELMALCDQLEQQQEDSINAHQTLVKTLLDALVDAASNSQNTEGKTKFEQAWERIAQHFDALFTTEDSIDQLKQTILQLAVMGKIVPQDPNDEPSIKLIEQLEADQSEWLHENLESNPECKTMLRKLDKLDRPVTPFEIPKSWTCCHLIQVCRLLVDCHNKTAPYVESGIPIIRTTNIRDREFNLKGVKFVTQETYDYWSRRCPPMPGDIMFTREAPMGEAAIIPLGVKWCLGQRTMLIRPVHEYIDTKYLLLTLTEPGLLERASEHAIGSTVKHLRVGDVENLSIPIPPKNEQTRIVEKLEELIEICDRLKSDLTISQSTQQHISNAIAQHALN